MALALERLAAWVESAADDPEVIAAAAEAGEIIAALVTDPARPDDPNPYGVPAAALERATLEVAADLYHRRASRLGLAGFDDGMGAGAPLRVRSDPAAAAYPILRRWVTMGVA